MAAIIFAATVWPFGGDGGDNARESGGNGSAAASERENNEGGGFSLDFGLGGGGGGELYANATAQNNDRAQIYPYGDQTILIPSGSAPMSVYLVENGSNNPPELLADAVSGFGNVVIGDDLYYTVESEEERFKYFLCKLSLTNGEETRYEDMEAESVRYDGESLYTIHYEMGDTPGYILSKIDTGSLEVTETFSIETIETNDYMIMEGKLYYRKEMPSQSYTVLDLSTGEESQLAPQGEDSYYYYLCGDDENLYYYYEGDNTVYAMPHGSDEATPVLDAAPLGEFGVSRLFADGNYLYVVVHEEGSGMSGTYRPYLLEKGGSSPKRLPVTISDFDVALGGWLNNGREYYHIDGDEVTEVVIFDDEEVIRQEMGSPMPLEEIE